MCTNAHARLTSRRYVETSRPREGALPVSAPERERRRRPLHSRQFRVTGDESPPGPAR